MNERLFAATSKTFKEGAVYPGYPTTRLSGVHISLDANDKLILPDGPWTNNNDNLPTAAESAAFESAGYSTDSHGRPLHPWLHQMIANPNIGVITGKGFYHNWGPNFTADPIVLTREVRPSVLLIQREDTGIWALPGGFVDPNETNPADTARRELFEETTLQLQIAGDLIYQDVVADLRTTANAWAETSAYAFVVDKRLPVAATDPNEVKQAAWFYVDSLPTELHGSHAALIGLALEHLKSIQDTGRPSIRDILNTSNEKLNTTIVATGHMAYDHLFVRTGDDCLFVKVHDATRFTDVLREGHSRAYLQKEQTLYTKLADEGFLAIPDRVELIDDVVLAMDALHQDEGWQWRAPVGHEFDQYVRQVLATFDQLQALPIPQKPQYHTAIEPTYATLWKEGWDAISDEKVSIIMARITQLSADWSLDQQHNTQELIQNFATLRTQAHSIERVVPLFMAHNDARQSNIAWHARHGAKLVDWSWADPAPKNADATMFLTDLVKSGHDVSDYAHYLNYDQIIVQIGFLLAHSIWDTRSGSTTIRQQQVASAVAAQSLLRLFAQ